MDAGRYVFLDPDGTQGEWLYVVVQAGTGVVYQQQYGGTATLLGGVEGYLVPIAARDPVTGRDGLRELRDVFERTLRGAGVAGAGPRGIGPGLLDRIRSAVGALRFWPSGPSAEPGTGRAPLRLDEERLPELDEAWVPVRTPDGPGVLMWDNSD
ncbi:DUF6210 family protein [Actinomadura sp. WMMB 499]|uniref:DUF6210 family protein n=1 Tax=Actinomadura sp. WMMB 499 TaxID=1219491 RepID=UPI00124659A5|nr:DUF6210 family protein [Actinomadura sp. WMMB 499]QFG21091.1 hypothetical protein F7P10_07995 [Actinomadura sp. WMMB 499]